MSKKKSLIIAICLIVSISIASMASSTPIMASNNTHTVGESELSLNEPRSAAAVAVFVGGILVGYVIDGIFIYATGHSAGELSAYLIQSIVDYVFHNLGASTIHVSSSGVIHGGGGGGF